MKIKKILKYALGFLAVIILCFVLNLLFAPRVRAPVPSEEFVSEDIPVFESQPPVSTEPLVTVSPEPEPEIEPEPPPVMLERFEELFGLNGDLVGWLKVDGTNIDYPVYWSGDNEFYLHHNGNKQDSQTGAIFLAGEAHQDCSDYSLSLFGHTLKNGTMFSELKKYKKLDFYQQWPTFEFDTLYSEDVYVIFSVMYMAGNASDGNFYYYPRTDFQTDEQRQAHANELLIRSVFDTGVDVTADDKIVILTCCTYETDNLRFAVAGRKLRADESAEAFIEQAKTAEKNPEPLYPAKWYAKFGGKAPVIVGR